MNKTTEGGFMAKPVVLKSKNALLTSYETTEIKIKVAGVALGGVAHAEESMISTEMCNEVTSQPKSPHEFSASAYTHENPH